MMLPEQALTELENRLEWLQYRRKLINVVLGPMQCFFKKLDAN